jgi:hypothetical protein
MQHVSFYLNKNCVFPFLSHQLFLIVVKFSTHYQVPSSFRIMRQLLDRIEDSKTGRVLIDEVIRVTLNGCVPG